MSAEKLTEAKVAQFLKAGLPEGKTEAMLWDGAVSGLGLRMRKGAASWIYSYRPKGAGRSAVSRKVTIGRQGAFSLKEAETTAKLLAGQVAQKKDPALDRRAEKTRERSELRLVLEGYDRSLRARKIVNAPTILSTLRRGLAPLLNREIDTLTRKDIVALIDAIENSGRPGAAQDLRKNARTLLEFAVSKGLAPHNVLAGMRKPRASRSERLEDAQKGRALDDAEIRTLWASAGSQGSLGGLLQLAMLTGLRRSELSGLGWASVLEDRIVIAAEHGKTGVAHSVPLTTAMRRVLEAQPRTTSPLVFPGRNNVRMTGWSKTIPNASAGSGVDFRLHDLRRTCRTLMSRLGVVEDVAELSIGHVRRGLLAIYNKDEAWPERIDAFERVSNHIAEILASP
jgi:integrase